MDLRPQQQNSSKSSEIAIASWREIVLLRSLHQRCPALESLVSTTGRHPSPPVCHQDALDRATLARMRIQLRQRHHIDSPGTILLVFPPDVHLRRHGPPSSVDLARLRGSVCLPYIPLVKDSAMRRHGARAAMRARCGACARRRAMRPCERLHAHVRRKCFDDAALHLRIAAYPAIQQVALSTRWASGAPTDLLYDMLCDLLCDLPYAVPHPVGDC